MASPLLSITSLLDGSVIVNRDVDKYILGYCTNTANQTGHKDYLFITTSLMRLFYHFHLISQLTN